MLHNGVSRACCLFRAKDVCEPATEVFREACVHLPSCERPDALRRHHWHLWRQLRLSTDGAESFLKPCRQFRRGFLTEHNKRKRLLLMLLAQDHVRKHPLSWAKSLQPILHDAKNLSPNPKPSMQRFCKTPEPIDTRRPGTTDAMGSVGS